MYLQDALHDLYGEAMQRHIEPRDERMVRIEFRKKVFLELDDEENHWAARLFTACQVSRGRRGRGRADTRLDDAPADGPLTPPPPDDRCRRDDRVWRLP